MTFDNYRRYTQARIGLGNVGPGLPTNAWLSFAYHHASATDAINIPWDLKSQQEKHKKYGYDSLILKTKITNREEYLQRPDLGQLLHDESKSALKKLHHSSGVLLVASNGLSSLAVINHLENFLEAFFAQFEREGLKLAHDRIMLVANGRVSLIDDIGEVTKPEIGLMIIGERPGLSSPDSLAVYLTYQPRHGRHNADRNCISNIRPPHGLGYEQAALKTIYLIKEALLRKISGVLLKENNLLELL